MHCIAGRKGESEMAQVKTVSGKKETWKERCARTAREVVKRRWLFFLLIPGITVSYTHLTLPTNSRV